MISKGGKIMPFEKGGRADKQGNSYEINCIIYEMLKVLNEINYSVIIEALGEDEIGTDILVTTSEGQKEHQQCKARNASKESWDIYDLKAKNILSAWKKQLDRDCFRKVALVSPMTCSFLFDLNYRACNTSDKAEDFYSVQIMKSSKEFQKFYKGFCEEMGINSDKDNDISKSIDYLKRISYKQISEYELQERINQYIQYLFSSERRTVYHAFLSLIVTGNILGQEITQILLTDYFKKQGIVFRLKDGDERIAPRIRVLNQEYRKNFIPLRGGLLHRKEFDDCIAAIVDEKSMIISGNAGYGKSGCTEAILNYCEERKIPHIAIKLDQRIPNKNCEAWGQELGLPSSIVHSIHCISRNENAVIVLDQLDALRWTQANSSEALAVCMELIRQVEYLNYERKKKIIIVFVCRTYDLENDNNIKLLFKADDIPDNYWKIIKVDDFEDSSVKAIVGKEYESLSPKLKKLLKIPSNLYIWEHLEKGEDYGDCLTTSHLINKWFEQICRKSVKEGIREKTINEVKKSIVDVLDKTGRLYVPKQILHAEEAGLDYLISSEIIVVQNNKVGFVHQSILDYLISQNMIEKYFKKQNIKNIIGGKNKQNPARRYQVQMFLQNILEYDSSDFIITGQKMLTSSDIRYYVKYIFYEILGQVREPDANIIQFIVDNCDNEIYGDYLLKDVIFGRKQYINILREKGILEKWYSEPAKKVVVFGLFQSIAPDLDDEDVSFIKKHAFNDRGDDERFMRCFFYDVVQESEEMFELRMMFYEHYPDYAKEEYIDVKSLMKKFDKRILRLISFWVKNKIKSQGECVYRYEEELVDINNSFLINNGELVLNELIQYIPKEIGLEVKYSAWSGRYFHKSVERVCVELVKKATIALIDKFPDSFWNYYETYMGKGYHVFNEIILTGLIHMPPRYSNRIIHYLATDLNKNIFDYTSGAEDELGLAEEILKIHGKTCNEEELLLIENIIYKYISPDAVELYKRRIERNRSKEYPPVYWSFWGDLQYKLLKCLPKERISKETKELLNVLDRRFYKVRLRYSNLNDHLGFVRSPVAGKKISKAQWLQIITNRRLEDRNRSKWVEVEGGFIESSYETYASDFQSVVTQQPQEMIELVLENKERVLPVFIDALFLGVEFSEVIEKVDFTIIEKVFIEFPCDMKSCRASYFCRIIEKVSKTNWAPEIIEQLIHIALKHRDPERDNTNVINQEDKEMKSCQMLHSNALNCVRGTAARVIGHLLWENKELFPLFKDTIESMIKDENPAVRFATLYALWPSYNIDRTWTEEKILYLYESDIRMASFSDSRDMFFYLYPKYRDKVIKIIEKCFKSDDKYLVEIGGNSVCEFYIRLNEFEHTMMSGEDESEEQVKAILDMAIIYLKVKKYRAVAKKIILHYKSLDMDIEFPLSKIFDKEYIDLRDDSEFLLELFRSKVGRKVVRAFVYYLEENAVSIVDYSEIIIQLCENVISMPLESLRKSWGLEDEISKLIISLYDETSNSSIGKDKKIADKCLELWDIMFEKQLGSVREISRKLMER